MNKGSSVDGYMIPEVIESIMKLDKEYRHAYHNDDLFGMFLYLGGRRYWNTPLDVIPFGWTGEDGIHYGFLTDFSSAGSLDEAWIVCVSPMSFDRPTTIIARNWHEFISLYIAIPDPFVMERFSRMSSKQQFNAFYQAHEEDLYERSQRLEPYFPILSELVDAVPIYDVYEYFREMKAERTSQIVVPTQDGIGILKRDPEGEHSTYFMPRNAKVDSNAVAELFQNATVESKLALVRDIQRNVLLRDEPLLKQLIIDVLMKLQLPNEASVLIHME